MTWRTLQSMRNGQQFDLFWEKGKRMAVAEESEVLHRRKKVPQRFETGSGAAEFPATAKDHFRRNYFDALDLLVQAITDRFDQPGYRTYRHRLSAHTNRLYTLIHRRSLEDRHFWNIWPTIVIHLNFNESRYMHTEPAPPICGLLHSQQWVRWYDKLRNTHYITALTAVTVSRFTLVGVVA